MKAEMCLLVSERVSQPPGQNGFQITKVQSHAAAKAEDNQTASCLEEFLVDWNVVM